jgi:GTP-binding protein Era
VGTESNSLPDATELPPDHRSGFVAIFGRPNAGKSTLLNRILGTKIAIVTPKPQTTRRRLLGVRTEPGWQIVFVDTPGYHRASGLLNQRMVANALKALPDADVVLWMIDAERGLDDLEEEIAQRLPAGRTVVIAVNKVDKVRKESLLPLLERLAQLAPGSELVPVSALTGDGVPGLLEILVAALPEGPRFYASDTLTDESERGLVAEFVREKVMLQTSQEVPYSVAVTVDSFEEKPDRNLCVIKATIHVERDSQKGILIGRGGQKLKSIGSSARRDVERLLGTKVFLELFVRVQREWTKRRGSLDEFGV